MSEESEYPVYPVTSDLSLHIIPISGTEVDLQVCEGGSTLYTEKIEREQWQSGHNRARIAGRIAEELAQEGGYQEEVVKARARRALGRVATDEREDDEFDEQIQTPALRDLIDRTAQVTVYPKESSAEWEIEIEPPSDSPHIDQNQVLEFDAGQLHGSNVQGFERLYFGVFLEPVDIGYKSWKSLVRFWTEIAESETREVDTGKAIWIERFLRQLKSQFDVFVEEESEDEFLWHSQAKCALYAENWENSKDAVLVPVDHIHTFTEEQNIEDEDFITLLRKREYVLGSTVEKRVGGDEGLFCPLDADKAGYADKQNVITDDDEPDGVDI